MKYLQKITEFAKEYTYDEVYELINEFIEEYEEFGFNAPSFQRGYYAADGDKDISELRKFLRKKGVNLDKFMKENLSTILEDSLYTAANGFFDYLLYTYDKTFPLSGGEMFMDFEEMVVKFDYGYQNYDIGKKYLLQNFKTLSDFFLQYIDGKIEELKLRENSYIIEEYDDNNVFLFIVNSSRKADSDFLEHFSGRDTIGIININAVYVLIFGDLQNKIKSKDDLDDYFVLSEIIEPLNFQASIKKYNL